MFCRSGQSIHKKLARISNFISRSTKKVKHFEKLQESLLKEAAEKETEIQKAEASLIKTQQELEKYQNQRKNYWQN